MAAAETQSRARTRILSVEILRVVSMLGIAVFHTFKPWFEQLTTGDMANVHLPVDPLMLGSLMHPIPLLVLGFIDQLGAWGNHVFIMISGCFLLPRAIEYASSDGADASQRQQTARRAKHILFTVGLYAACALLVDTIYPDVTSASLESTTWLTQGLQFIWVYLVIVVACPLIARVWRHCRRPEMLLAATALFVYAVNLYIAFVSPGSSDRSLFEWRKIMSAVTYGLSFVIGGWIAMRCQERSGKDKKSSLLVLLLSVTVTILIEAYAALKGDLLLLDALSFKSTSLLACAMATTALAFALSVPRELGAMHPRVSSLIAFSTSGMLGFYVLQSLFSYGWHTISNDMLAQALSFGVLPFLAAGLVFSVALFLVLVTIDTFVRQPLFAWLHL